jgi:hypothetical protein
MNEYVCVFQVEALFAHRESMRLERLLAAGAQELRKAKPGRRAGGL